MINRKAPEQQPDRLPGWGPLVLLVIAFCYYGLYWRSGLMLGGEEGVAAVVAQRLNAGQLPIVDTFLGYNVGWFYPIAWIFKLGGANYLLLRGYFFFLGMLAGMVAYTIVWLVTQRNLLALATGMIVILMPGLIGRNYMGLLGLLGMLTILGAFILPVRSKVSRVIWMLAAGLAISLAWLIRIDIGFFQTTLFLLTALLFLFKPEEGFVRRLGMVALAGSLLIASFCAIQGPVYRDALHRGFGRKFADQYWVWPAMIRDAACKVATDLLRPHSKPEVKPELTPELKRIENPGQPVAPVEKKSLAAPASFTSQASPLPRLPVVSSAASPGITPTSVTTSKPVVAFKPSDAEESDSVTSFSDASLKRPPLSSILHARHFRNQVFVLLIYLPLLVSLLFILLGLWLLLASLFLRDVKLWEKGSILLVSTGSSLLLFPQFFFWRPDMIHLGEFMLPFMVTLVVGMSILASALRTSRSLGRLLLCILIAATGLNLAVYLVKGWETDGTGSIAASRRRHLDFTALNGVHVKLNPQEFRRDTLLRDTILRYSAPGDFVVCYPYFPMVNFMTDRPSYEYNLYIDNGIKAISLEQYESTPDQFFDHTIQNFNLHHPAVVIIGTGKVNSTEASRFGNWASKAYAYIKEHFTLVAKDEELEIYARKR